MKEKELLRKRKKAVEKSNCSYPEETARNPLFISILAYFSMIKNTYEKPIHEI